MHPLLFAHDRHCGPDKWSPRFHQVHRRQEGIASEKHPKLHHHNISGYVSLTRTRHPKQHAGEREMCHVTIVKIETVNRYNRLTTPMTKLVASVA